MYVDICIHIFIYSCHFIYLFFSVGSESLPMHKGARVKTIGFEILVEGLKHLSHDLLLEQHPTLNKHCSTNVFWQNHVTI